MTLNRDVAPKNSPKFRCSVYERVQLPFNLFVSSQVRFLQNQLQFIFHLLAEILSSLLVSFIVLLYANLMVIV